MKWAVSLLLCWVVAAAWAQTEHMTLAPRNYLHNLNHEAGLSHANVMAITQDLKGALWVGTANGLNRYDGKTVFVLPNGKYGLSGDSITALARDAYGQIWVGALNGGLSVLDTGQQAFHAVTPRRTVVKKLVVGQGEAWALTKSGLLHISFQGPVGGALYQVQEWPVPISRFQVQAHLTLWNNKLVLAHNTHLWTWSTGKWEPLNTKVPDVITSLYADGHKLHVGTAKAGIWTLQTGQEPKQRAVGLSTFYQLVVPETHKNAAIPESWQQEVGSFRAPTAAEFMRYLSTKRLSTAEKNQVLKLAHHTQSTMISGIVRVAGRLYITSPENVYQEQKGGEFMAFHDPMVSPSESVQWSFQVAYAAQDQTLWLGTNKHGLFRVSALEQGLVTYPFALACDKCHKRIYTLHTHGQKVWLGLRGTYSLAQFNLDTKQYTFYGKAQKLACWEVSSIYNTNSGRLYLGGSLCGLSHYRPEVPSTQKLDLNALERQNTWILNDQTGAGFWIGSTQHLYRFNEKTASLSTYKSLYEDEYAFYRGVQYGAHQYWVNKSFSTLHILDTSSGTLSASSLKLPHTKSQRLHALTIVGSTLWLLTSQGLWLVPDLGRGMGTKVLLAGQRSYQAKAFAHAPDKTVWLTTGQWLVHLDTLGQVLHTYGPADGLPLRNITAISILPSGQLLIGSDEGLSVLQPPISISLPTLQVMLSEVRVGYQLLDSVAGATEKPKPIWATKRVNLGPDQHSLSFKFSLPGLDAYSSTRYACKLDEVDAQWIELGGRAYVNYDYLAPGTYTLLLKAQVGQLPATQPTAITIYVAPKFYQTGWFKLLVALLLVLATVVVIKYRERAHILYQQTLQRQVAARTEDLRTANAILADKAEVIVRQHADLERKNQILTEQKEEILAQRDELAHAQQHLTHEYEELTKQTHQLKKLINHGADTPEQQSAFTQRVVHIIHENIEMEGLGPDVLSRELGMSRTVLYQKFKQEIGKPVGEFIRETRLEEGARILLQEKLTVTEVAFRVGFSSYAYFTKCFHDYYGKSPTQFLAEVGEKAGLEK